MLFAIFQSPFLTRAASFKNKLPLSPDYISFQMRFGNSNLVANPTCNPEQKLMCCKPGPCIRPVLLQTYKTFSSEIHDTFVPCCCQ